MDYIGIIEKWGTGTLNIIEWCKENGNPPPEWRVRTGSVVLTFKPLADDSEKQPESQLGPQQEPRQESRQESLRNRIIELIQKGPLSRSEISKKLAHKKISGQLNNVLKDLLIEKVVEYTIPDKPQSRLQRYKLIKKDKKF